MTRIAIGVGRYIAFWVIVQRATNMSRTCSRSSPGALHSVSSEIPLFEVVSVSFSTMTDVGCSRPPRHYMLTGHTRRSCTTREFLRGSPNLERVLVLA